MLVLILLASFVAALLGLFIGRVSRGLMVGVVYIKLVMLLFIAVPILCALTGVDGPLAALCCLVPSQPAFEGILALSAGDRGTALHNSGILLLHGLAWFALYGAIALRRKRSG